MLYPKNKIEFGITNRLASCCLLWYVKEANLRVAATETNKYLRNQNYVYCTGLYYHGSIGG